MEEYKIDLHCNCEINKKRIIRFMTIGILACENCIDRFNLELEGKNEE